MESSDHKVKLFVGGLPKEANEDTLRNHFSQFGEIKESLIIREKNTRTGRGFGFVTFTDSSMVDKALRHGDEHDHLILGKKVDVKQALPREKQRNGYISNGNNQCWSNKIFVGGLPDNLTNEEFRSYFEDFGTVTDSVVISDKHTSRPRGFGFITFDSQDAAERVLKQNSYELKNKMVEVKRAQPKYVNDKYMNIYDAYHTYIGHDNSPYNSYVPFSPCLSYPAFPMVQHYYCWSPTFYAPNYGWGSPSTMNYSSTIYNGNSSGDNNRGKVKISTPAKALTIDAYSSSKSYAAEEIDDPSSPKSSVAEIQIGEIEIDDSPRPKSSTIEPQSAGIDDSLQLENNATQVQIGVDGSSPNHVVDEQ